MNINFKQFFPWPGSDGRPVPTEFAEKVDAALYHPNDPQTHLRKRHTIRRVPGSGKARFREGMMLDLTMGPRFKPVRFARTRCTGVQLLQMEMHHRWPLVVELEVRIYGRLANVDVGLLAANDGLTLEQFTRWFALDLLVNGSGQYQIVHWTELRY